MIALADFPVILLGLSALVLGASTMMMSVKLPSISWRRRPAPPQHANLPIHATYRRIFSGQPSVHSPLALPVAGPVTNVTSREWTPPRSVDDATEVVSRPHRQALAALDVHHHDPVQDAEATIDYFLAADPGRIARVMMEWINDGERRSVDRA